MAAKLTDLDGVMSLKAKGLLAFFSSIGTIYAKKRQMHRISYHNRRNYCGLLAISTTDTTGVVGQTKLDLSFTCMACKASKCNNNFLDKDLHTDELFSTKSICLLIDSKIYFSSASICHIINQG